MNITKKIFFFFILVMVLGLGLSKFMPKEKKIEQTDIRLRIGSGDDITGLLLEQIINKSKEMSTDSPYTIEEKEAALFDFTFKDC